VVVRDKQTLNQLAAVLPGGKMLVTATLAIVVCADVEVAFERHIGFLVQDCSAAIENLLLAAHALGLGACWVGVYPLEDAVRKVRQTLSAPASIIPVAVISLGHPGEQLAARSRYNPDHVHFEKW
jgi:nitroreductase